MSATPELGTREDQLSELFKVARELLLGMIGRLWEAEDATHHTARCEQVLDGIRGIDDLEHDPPALEFVDRCIETTAKAIELEGQFAQFFHDDAVRLLRVSQLLKEV